MNNKRSVMIFSFVILFLGLASLIIPLISAQNFYVDLRYGADQVIRGFQDILGPIFAALIGVSEFDQYFFARVLLLIVVYIVCSITLSKTSIFKERTGVIVIISAVVAILGARYIAEFKFIEAILLPYGTITIAITTLFPFLLYFYFVHNSISSGAGRRIAWIFFAVIFLGLWWTRRADTSLDPNLRWIYNIAIIAVVVTVIFDKKIHEYFGIMEAQQARNTQLDYMIAQTEADIAKLSQVQNPTSAVRDTIDRLERRKLELIRKKH